MGWGGGVRSRCVGVGALESDGVGPGHLRGINLTPMLYIGHFEM